MPSEYSRSVLAVLILVYSYPFFVVVVKCTVLRIKLQSVFQKIAVNLHTLSAIAIDPQPIVTAPELL